MDHNRSMQQSSSSSSSSASPTTFVQADANTFRELVQKLTGADDNSQDKLPVTLPSRYSSSRSPNPNDGVGPRRSAFKLQERRHNMRKLEIKLGHTSIQHSSSPSPYSPRRQILSPIPSPVTPLISDTVFCQQRYMGSGTSSPAAVAVEVEVEVEEEKAIAEKGFYLHPSPLSTPRSSDPPELLTLFPLQSPKQHSRDL